MPSSAASTWRSGRPRGGLAAPALIRPAPGPASSGDDREAELVDQVGGGQRAEELRAALAEQLAQPAPRNSARPAARSTGRCRSAATRPRRSAAGRCRGRGVGEHDRADRRVGEDRRAGSSAATGDHHQGRVLGQAVLAAPGPAASSSRRSAR